MAKKECDPKCTGKCNKQRLKAVSTADKACNPKCTAKCSKKNAAISTIPEGLLENQNKGSLLQPGAVNFVIMDLDGVILDIELVYQWVIEDLASKYGISSKEVPRIVDLQDEETAKKICADYNLSVSPQDFMIDFRKTSAKHLAKTPLMPGIEKLTDYLSENNIPVAVATSSNEEAFKLKTAKHAGFFKKFSHIVLGGSDPAVDTRKPSPKIYEVCGSRFPSKPNPKTILVLEDAPEGVQAATAAQMNVVWFPNKYMNKEKNNGALAVYDSIGQFDPKLFGLSQIK